MRDYAVYLYDDGWDPGWKTMCVSNNVLKVLYWYFICIGNSYDESDVELERVNIRSSRGGKEAKRRRRKERMHWMTVNKDHRQTEHNYHPTFVPMYDDWIDEWFDTF